MFNNPTSYCICSHGSYCFNSFGLKTIRGYNKILINFNSTTNTPVQSNWYKIGDMIGYESQIEYRVSKLMSLMLKSNMIHSFQPILILIKKMGGSMEEIQKKKKKGGSKTERQQQKKGI